MTDQRKKNLVLALAIGACVLALYASGLIFVIE